MKKLQKTLVTVLLHGGIVNNIFVDRVSNTTLKTKKSKVPDSDVVMLEDKHGHRYKVATPINPDNDFHYFGMI